MHEAPSPRVPSSRAPPLLPPSSWSLGSAGGLGRGGHVQEGVPDMYGAVDIKRWRHPLDNGCGTPCMTLAWRLVRCSVLAPWESHQGESRPASWPLALSRSPLGDSWSSIDRPLTSHRTTKVVRLPRLDLGAWRVWEPMSPRLARLPRGS